MKKAIQQTPVEKQFKSKSARKRPSWMLPNKSFQGFGPWGIPEFLKHTIKPT